MQNNRIFFAWSINVPCGTVLLCLLSAPAISFFWLRPDNRWSAPVTHLDQGIRCIVKPLQDTPAPGLYRPQKSVGSVPCSNDWVTILMVFNQPRIDSRHRQIKAFKQKHADNIWRVIRFPIKSDGYANPINGSPQHPNCQAKSIWLSKGTWSRIM